MTKLTISANTLGTFMGNQLAAQAKQHYAEYQAKKYLEAEYHRSQIPEIGQELEASERRFIKSVVAHPHEHGLPPTSSSSQRSVPRSAAAHTTPVSHNKNTNNSVDKVPPQEHLIVERAREEEVMNRAARWNKEQNKTAKASQGGFWSLVERAGNSPVVAAINEIGDNVAHTVMDMVNPVKKFKTAMADADESIHAFQSGNILQGIASTGKTTLDLLPFVPLEGFAVGAVRYGVAEVGARVGIFRGGSAVVEKIGQTVPIKHPLAGLSSDNVIRLVDELGVATPRDQLILWSGLGRGEEGIRLSRAYAAKYGGITLEMTPGGSWLHKMDLYATNSPFTREQVVDIWSSVSKSLTEQASGQVRSLLGQVRPKSIYLSQEMQELYMNKRVLGIDEIYLKPKFDTILN
ncbi:MAG: hypothetical protein WC627_06140 [Legionella sp.]|jgi:hypothetical protein